MGKGERSIHINALPCAKSTAAESCQITQGTLLGALWWPRRAGWGEAGKLKREVMCVCLWRIHVVVWQKPTQYGEVIFLQLKKKKEKHEKQNSKLWMSAKDGDDVPQGRCQRGGGPRRAIQPREHRGPSGRQGLCLNTTFLPHAVLKLSLVWWRPLPCLQEAHFQKERTGVEGCFTL